MNLRLRPGLHYNKDDFLMGKPQQSCNPPQQYDLGAQGSQQRAKKLRQAYNKAEEANNRFHAMKQTCRFYKELHAIQRSAGMEPEVLKNMLMGLASMLRLAVELLLKLQTDSEESDDDVNSRNASDTRLLVAFTDMLTTMKCRF
ncbi:hypothetical protein UY3_09544 [Chelonia mydas]|uniref:Uncharacterized protein n=1 Tax=Chelonia mydas TaxID=8469 RepID=M7B874_CHEMY|nr:hypothetical protein UY3_09544 [Chelonia mydas]